MKFIKQHKVILAIILTSTLSSGCQLLGPLMGMLTGGGLTDTEGGMFMTSPDAAAQKLGYQCSSSAGTSPKSSAAGVYGFYPLDN